MDVEFMKSDNTKVVITVNGLDTKFSEVREQIKQQIETDYFKIKKILPNQNQSNENNEKQKKIDLNETIGQYMDPELTYSFEVIQMIPMWIYYGNEKLYKMFNLDYTFDDVTNYAFGIKLNNEEVKVTLVGNDNKDLDLQVNYHQIQLHLFQKNTLPLHLYIKSKIQNPQLSFAKHEKNKQKSIQKQQFSQHFESQKQIQQFNIQQEQKVKIEQNNLHYSLQIERNIKQENIQINQGMFEDLEQDYILLNQAKQKFMDQFEKLKQKLKQYCNELQNAIQREEGKLLERKYQKQNSSSNLNQQKNVESQIKELQSVLQKTTSEVESIVSNLNQQSQNEKFTASFDDNISQGIIVNEILDQKTKNISSKQDFKVHQKLLEKFINFISENEKVSSVIGNLNFEQQTEDLKQIFEKLNQSCDQNDESNQQINNSGVNNQFIESQSIQDSVILTQISQNSPFYNDNQFQPQ